MPEYAYTPNTGKLKEFLKKIREIQIPTSGASQDWFQLIGFKSSNDRPILRVMKQIKFIDDSGKPTDLWIQYRTSDHKKILASGIIQGYRDLYAIYPDAHNRSTEDLASFFTKKSTAGKQVIDKTINTFKALCELAEFNGIDIQKTEHEPLHDESSEDQSIKKSAISQTKNQVKGSGVTININIQLTLPDTTDAAVYDNFFASMKKHIFENGY